MLNTREVAAEYRLTHWAGIIRERNESGKSIKAYCESIGVRTNVYFYWQKKLREVACQELLPTVTNNGKMTKTPNGWAVCELESNASTETGSEITIEIGKSKVTASVGTDLELLESVCRMLMSIC